jgi:osmotically-inducible protein OsmY
MNRLVNILVGFAAGSLAVWWVAGVSERRRMPADFSDDELRKEVRRKLGEWVSHPELIDVEVHAGIVRVTGNVLEHESDLLLSRLTYLPGVRKVHNALSRRTEPRTQNEPLEQGQASSSLRP